MALSERSARIAFFLTSLGRLGMGSILYMGSKYTVGKIIDSYDLNLRLGLLVSKICQPIGDIQK